MFEIIAHTNLRLVSSLEESIDFEVIILSISLKMNDCDWKIQKAMMKDFGSMFSNSKNERLRHFDVLDIKVILLLMHFEFRHTASKLIWEHHDDDNNDHVFWTSRAYSLIWSTDLKSADEIEAEEKKRLKFKKNETKDSEQAKPLHKKCLAEEISKTQLQANDWNFLEISSFCNLFRVTSV